MIRGFATVMVLFVWMGCLCAQAGENARFEVHEVDGGPVFVRTAAGFLNQNSSLKRRWVMIDDLSSPVRLNRTGVITRFEEKEQMVFFVPVGSVSPMQGISAVEVRYLLFDVWGERIRTLSVTRLADSSASVDLREGTAWPAWEEEASRLVTVVAVASRARTGEGQIWSFDPEKLAPEFLALGLNVAAADFTPDPQPALPFYWPHDRYGNMPSPTGKTHP